MIRSQHVAAPSPLPLDQPDYGFPLTRVRGRTSIDSVSDDERQIASRLDALAISGTTAIRQEDVAFKSDDEEEEDLEEEGDLAEETALRYARLQARGRAAELAYNNRIQRESMTANATAPSSSRRDRSRSNSKSRSRPSTPMLGALFKRDNFAMSITRSQSPPVNSIPDKSSRRPSVTNLFKFKPLSRSSSSKSIQVSSTSSSVPTSPFPSPLTPLSPLPFFLSPKLRRKPMPSTGEDIEVAALSGPSPSFGSPLTRTPRRPSPVRTMTLPDDHSHYQDVSTTPSTVRRRPSHGAHVHTLYSGRSRRETSPLGRSDNSTVIVPALGPHLVKEEQEEERQSALSLIIDAQ